ncbi:hypothetical protein ZIOFF_035228 [Zingiber officinale]|uniref:Uncharacterized protein n=1 Tax=Zingiber officinale TaxID=94328 RepID=A0A8J5GG21_ZINOF|nr:hypothetical protein ZIOFF_035228 [Zingiber officinale]
MTLHVNLKFPSPSNIIFFSISKDSNPLHSYKDRGQDVHALDLDWSPRSNATTCGTPTPRPTGRTTGFLMRDGYSLFAIDNGADNAEMLAFLERLRDAYRNTLPKHSGSNGTKPKVAYKPKDLPKVKACSRQHRRAV